MGVAKWLGINVVLWGIATACHAAATSYTTMLVCRIFLGIFEAAIAPCLMLLSSQWYSKCLMEIFHRPKSLTNCVFLLQLVLNRRLDSLSGTAVWESDKSSEESFHMAFSKFAEKHWPDGESCSSSWVFWRSSSELPHSSWFRIHLCRRNGCPTTKRLSCCDMWAVTWLVFPTHTSSCLTLVNSWAIFRSGWWSWSLSW